MYLIDTDVLSEFRKGRRANAGVRRFMAEVERDGTPMFVSVISIGEIRRGVGMIRNRGDESQALLLERWLESLLQGYADRILSFDADCAQMWGQLRFPNGENPLDKQIAATAYVHGLTVVTGNVGHFRPTGVPLHDPFSNRA